MCVCEREKKEPFEGVQMLTRVGLVFFFSVYARYFSTMCHIEGQGLFVPSEAQPAPKAAATVHSISSIWHQSETAGC